MAKILVTGATGLLGSSLVPALVAAGHVVVGHSHRGGADVSCDLADGEQAVSLVGVVRPDVIVNLVALTDVDRCEIDPNAAYRTNALTVGHICKAIKAARQHTHLVHISTDMVYDNSGPHLEDDVVIRNIYALSKLAGEYAAAQVPHTILRTNFIGRSRLAGRRSLSDWLFDALAQRVAIGVFEDVLFNPLSIDTLCLLMTKIVSAQPTGLFNLGSTDGLSKADMAYQFAGWLGLGTSAVTRSKVEEMTSLKARRPKDMRMDCSRFSEAMSVRLPTLTEELRLVAKEYQ